MNGLYAVWPFPSGLIGKSAAGRHQRVGVSTDSSFLIQKHRARNPGTDKENTHFEIRMRIFIHSQWADTFHETWWNTVMAMIFTCGTSVTSIRERERSPYSSSNTAAVAVGLCWLCSAARGGVEDESGANMWLMMTHETALFACSASRTEYQPARLL